MAGGSRDRVGEDSGWGDKEDCRHQVADCDGGTLQDYLSGSTYRVAVGDDSARVPSGSVGALRVDQHRKRNQAEAQRNVDLAVHV